MDKENKSHAYKSKIPLPVKPLPPMSEDSIRRPSVIKAERHPLQTLFNPDCQNIEQEPSRTTEKVKRAKRKLKNALRLIDTRHVTLRQKNNDLDWDYNVFNENLANCSSIGQNQEKDCARETSKIATPALKSPIAENWKIKNIKKSLKRPHSRELQGISPVEGTERKETHKRRLYFTEFQPETQDIWKKTYTVCLNQSYTRDLFAHLLNKESVSLKPDIPKDTRACILNWLIKINEPEGNPAVVQTAIWYFDTFLGCEHVALDEMQVSAAAAYWISQKVHGRAPTARKLVKASCNAFSAQLLVQAERAILRKLNFPASPVTPQEFITYFSWYCDEVQSTEIELMATIFCMAGLVVNKALCNECPSVIGAAAVRNSVLLLKTSIMLAKLEKNSIYKNVAEKQSCSNVSFISALQRRAVRKMSSPTYEYGAILKHYDNPPYFASRKVISFVCNYAAGVK